MSRAFAILLPGILLVPGLVFLANTGDLSVYLREPVPPGQLLYVLSRLAGLYALAFIWLQILLGAFRSELEEKLGAERLVRVHARLGGLTLALLLTHVFLFLGGVALRSGGDLPLGLLWPDFFAGYYRRMLSLGAVALLLVLLGAAAAFLRGIPRLAPVWRRLHQVNYAVFFLAFLHSTAIGSETRLQPLSTLTWLFFASALVAPVGARLTRTAARSISDGSRGSRDRAGEPLQ